MRIYLLNFVSLLALTAACAIPAGPALPPDTLAPVQLIPREQAPRTPVDNLHLTTVLVAGGPPYPGSTFTVLREEPAAFGRFRRKTMAVSGPRAYATFSVNPGRYLVQVRNGALATEQVVQVPADGVHQAELVLQAGELELHSLMRADGEPAEQTWFRIYREERDAYGRPARVQVAGNGYASGAEFLLPAGDYLAEAVFGNTRRQQRLTVTAGTRSAHTFILDAGMLELSAVLSTDGEPADGVRFSVYRRQLMDDGREHWTEFTRAEEGAAIGFALPAGEYLARATLGHAEVGTTVQVEAGESLSAELQLNAGKITVFAALPDGPQEILSEGRFWLERVGGEQVAVWFGTAVSSGAEPKAGFVVPAGDYLAFAQAGEAVGSVPIEVIAGAQQTLSIPIEAARVALQLQADDGSARLPNTWFSVYRVESADDGSARQRRVFNRGYSPRAELILPPGEYVAFARAGSNRGERRFRVDDQSMLSVVLKTGQ